ncbi:synaptophysin-like isoform X2 [Neocloeon triangulifer]|uniref:synaptophysin-like isoform X2 n=1 Tax=Neocloeon triangulifer TaxID=2078957 RepID=UPI00286EC50F|nr:synaptophysin-like isoform X2 [Neocloeon triangulifer]
MASQEMPSQYDTGMQPPGGAGGGGHLQALRSAMQVNLDVFREPRGVMRIIHLVFSLFAIITICSYDNEVTFAVKCPDPQPRSVVSFPYDYPFKLDHISRKEACSHPESRYLTLYGDFSSDAEFFVAVGVLSLLGAAAASAIYALYEAQYQSNPLISLADFGGTALFALLWLSASAAWANGLSGIKHSTEPAILMRTNQCGKGLCENVTTGSFSGLNISVILGFLNFFLWTSDLWFIYKETPWFKMKQQPLDQQIN